jgi:hypothetical protein
MSEQSKISREQKPNTVIFSLLCITFFSSCAAFREAAAKITIQQAIRDAVEAMNIASDGAKKAGPT